MPHLSKISIIEWNSLFSSWQMRLMPFRATQVDFPKRKFKKFLICQIYEFTGIRHLNHRVCFPSFKALIIVHWSQSFFAFFLEILFPLLQLMEVWDGEWGGGQEEVLNVRPVLHTRNTFCKTLKYSLKITRNTFCKTLKYSLLFTRNIFCKTLIYSL